MPWKTLSASISTTLIPVCWLISPGNSDLSQEELNEILEHHQIPEEMIPYMLHVTVILTVCFLFYKLFLQKATFYGLNRWTLLGCLVLSFILPLLPAPRGSWGYAMTANTFAAKPAIQSSSAFDASSIDPKQLTTAVASTASFSPKSAAAQQDRALYAPATINFAVTTPAPDECRPAPAAAAIQPAAPPQPSHPFLSASAARIAAADLTFIASACCSSD